MALPGRPRTHDSRADSIRQAICYSTLEEVQSLVDVTGPDVLDGDARTPLAYAARENKKEVMEWLLAAGAAINHQDRHGASALHFAVSAKHLQVVRYLLAKGAMVDAKDAYGNSPLWRAAFDAGGNYGLVEILLAHNADPDSKNGAGRSPYDFAVQIGDSRLQALLKRKANHPPEPMAPSSRGSS